MLISFPVFGKEDISSCKIENNKVISQNICYGFININEHFTYQGEFNNGRINGEGKFIWLKKKLYKEYIGEFKDDKLHGQGKLTWVNGDVYIGSFVLGRQKGYGKKIFKNGNLYLGYFDNDFFNGMGKYVDVQSNIYEGNFKNGKVEGEYLKYYDLSL